MRIQVIFGILWIFSQTAAVLLFQDPVVCKFNKNEQCYVALGEQLHLQIPPAYAFNLNMRDDTSAIRTIIRFRNNNPNSKKSDLPRWQFVKENNTVILTSAETSDSGTYILDTSDAGGTLTGSYTLQLNINERTNLSSNVTDTTVSLFPDPVCIFTENDQCYVALEEQLYMQMPLVDGFNLNMVDKTSAKHTILRYRKNHSNPPKPNLPRWQFVNELMILTNAERSDSGTYILDTFDAGGTLTGRYTLQLNIKGLLFKDPVVCTFTGNDQCYVDLEEELHLQMPSVDGFNLNMVDKTSAKRTILRYRKNHSNPPKPNFPRWHIVNDLMILTSAERSDSGTYILDTFDAEGTATGRYTLQLNIKGLLFPDPVCIFTGNDQCYVALGEELHLQMPSVDGFDLNMIDKTPAKRTILRYRKTQSNPPKPNFPRWQFVNNNNTMILTSAERNDSGTYILDTFDTGGTATGRYTLQLNIEEPTTLASDLITHGQEAP
ncbi:uncharacterized protein LOC124396898 isoform X1 [Silurus meridionalis]|uniref:Ig-like domain-containing protein n=1 Tax=Silurus meridionalis TaxID=175797 RepID=A0A8T0B2B6_SILME|nr:uncharacterized protein LOC124396898 isoform X1 [Silurus meridionalis]KAF7698367.1 hypothetical protein HF521_004877 [Silurus meridionalis]